MNTEKQAEPQSIGVEEMNGGRAAWEAHRQALGGHSAITGAALPDWAGCNEKVKLAHVAIYKALKQAFMGPAGFNAFKATSDGPSVTPG